MTKETDRLDLRILEYLKRKTRVKGIRVRISEMRRKYPALTLNAAAHIWAQKRKLSVARYLTEKDRESLKSVKLEPIPIKIGKQRKRLIKIANYETDDKLLKAHIDEINKTYTYGCYTACFVLCRKVLENLLLNILKVKYPGKDKTHRERYWDFNRNRPLEFSRLLKSLRENKNDFIPENKLVERICILAEKFKETADEMTHSLYHIASKKEMDEMNFQQILDLIRELFKKLQL
jgi:hypothetical protein